MSADKKVPEIRFKGFSGEWRKQCLGEIVTCFSGGTPLVSVNEYYKGNIPFIRSAEINKTVTELTISESGLKNSSAKLVELGTVLYALYGATSGEVGRARICGAINQAILAIVPTAKISPEFLVHWFRKNKGNIVNTYLQGGQGNLSGEIIKNLILNFTDFEEQSVIGSYIQKLDNLINQHQQKHDKLSNIKKAMLEKMFPKQGETIPEIRFKGFSGAWEEKELGVDVAEIIGGGTPSTSISEFWNGDIDWYSPTEIGNNVYAEGSQKKITALGLKNSSAKILPAGNTVLFTSRAGIGDMAILAKPGATNQGFQSFIVKDGFSPYFIYSAGKQIKEFALKHASGSTFLEISGKQLGRMVILIPNFEEQTAIGNYFQKLDMLINQHQQQITKLKNIKQACLSKMFI